VNNNPIIDAVKEVDKTFLFIFAVAAALLFLITAALVVFLIRYHHGRHPQAASFKDNLLAELIWILLPCLIVLTMFASGWKSYLALQNAPADAMRVDVTARKWSWTFTYENGRNSNILYVPINRDVLLHMTSLDVIHSFYAPAFRIKRDTVPGMTTSLWFRSPKAGEFDAMCAEYCGLGHSAMHTKIVVLPPGEFDLWYKGGRTPRGGKAGRELYMKHGCIGCHPLDGLQGVGPSLDRIYGTTQVVVTGQRERPVVADELYIRRSILRPNAEVVKGYPPVMPPYEGLIPQQDLDELVAFLKFLAGEQKP
jgi:cytochrome c oxidase subunit II